MFGGPPKSNRCFVKVYMTRRDHIVEWYRERSPILRSTVAGIRGTVIFAGGAVLEPKVSAWASATSTSPSILWLIAAMFALFVITVVDRQVRRAFESYDRTREHKSGTLAYANSALEQCLAEDIKFAATSTEFAGGGWTCKSCGSQDPIHQVKSYLTQLHGVLESRYGESEKIDGRIDFETSLFSRSYQDSNLTIVAWANRHGRAPTSMRLRLKDPNIYDKTVAAHLYRQDSPLMDLIPDTSADSKYVSLYDRQEERIRSTIVFPVLSASNKLLGVLVVHCNRTGFFRTEEARWWQELLEIFAKRSARELIRVQHLVRVRPKDEAKPY